MNFPYLQRGEWVRFFSNLKKTKKILNFRIYLTYKKTVRYVFRVATLNGILKKHGKTRKMTIQAKNPRTWKIKKKPRVWIKIYK